MYISYGDGQRLTPDETLSYYGFVEQAAWTGAAANQELCTLGSSRFVLRLHFRCFLIPRYCWSNVCYALRFITWRHVFADDRTPDLDSDAEEVRRLHDRIASAKLQADALEQKLRQLQTTSSGERAAANAAARHRAALALEYCNARLARLQATKDSVDGAEISAAAADGASGTRQTEL
eukprot:COSAG02_NODE_9174_length_2301_cov_7.955495_1_plen_178_part_00